MVDRGWGGDEFIKPKSGRTFFCESLPATHRWLDRHSCEYD